MNAFISLIRGSRRQRLAFCLNLTGLSLGIGCSYLIFMWSADELAFDKFHKNYEHIYLVQIADKNLTTSIATPPPLASALKEKYPEIIQSTRYAYHSGGELVEYGLKKVYATGMEADASFFDIFSFPLADGEKNISFDEPNSILLTENFAYKLFGAENPLGKTLKFRNGHLMVVRGILKDIPQNSSINFDYVLPFAAFYKGGKDEWGMWYPATIVKLSARANKEEVAQKIQKFTKIHERKERQLTLFAFSDIHFNLEDQAFFQKYTNYIHLQAMLVMAVFILGVSCLNYINLSTALFSKRAKEVGIKKVLGAEKPLLIWQFLKEALIQGMIAVIITYFLLLLFEKFINGFAQKDIVNLLNFSHALLFIGLGLLIAFLSGIYPSLFLSSAPPLSLIRQFNKSAKRTFTLRGILLVSQFTITIIILICSIILNNQINYIRNKDLGYDKNHLLAIPMGRGQLEDKSHVIKQELASLSGVEQVSMGSFRYLYFDEKVDKWDGKQDDGFMKLYALGADYKFDQTIGFRLLKGRFFSEKFNEEANLVINEEAARQMGMKDPVGKKVNWRNKEQTIIGVVKDFNYWGLSKKIEPIFIFQASWGDVYVKISEHTISKTVSHIAAVFHRHNPAFPFEYYFIDQEVDALYEKENRMESILFYLTGVCMFLSGLGLYALSSFVMGEKMKEISIKKMLGAPIHRLFSELSLLFLKWVFLACLIAIPIAVWGMNQWLSSYAYHINIHTADILLALLITVAAALAALIGSVLKASLKNPLEFIRLE